MDQFCDHLIIGGGSAGCVVAKRLAERGTARIILVEAGNSDEGDPAATDLKRLDEQTSDYDWGFTATTLEGGNAELKYARAKLLGGCANHNDCAFIRPPDSDFAEWETRGAAGWGPRDMDPMWHRILERVSISQCTLNPLSTAFIKAGEELGLPRLDFSRTVAAGVGPFPLNAVGRTRQSSSIAYLHPLKELPPHLEVWTNTYRRTDLMRWQASDWRSHVTRKYLCPQHHPCSRHNSNTAVTDGVRHRPCGPT